MCACPGDVHDVFATGNLRLKGSATSYKVIERCGKQEFSIFFWQCEVRGSSMHLCWLVMRESDGHAVSVVRYVVK